jgi:hypothetical protein
MTYPIDLCISSSEIVYTAFLNDIKLINLSVIIHIKCDLENVESVESINIYKRKRPAFLV